MKLIISGFFIIYTTTLKIYSNLNQEYNIIWMKQNIHENIMKITSKTFLKG